MCPELQVDAQGNVGGVGPSEYHQMIKFKKGLLDPFKLFIVIQDFVGLDKLIERAKKLEAEVAMTSRKELSSGLTREKLLINLQASVWQNTMNSWETK